MQLFTEDGYKEPFKPLLTNTYMTVTRERSMKKEGRQRH